MSIKHGSNRFFPRAGDGGGVVPPGAGLWTLYGGSVVGLTTLTDTVSIGTAAMLADEKLLVAGGIAATPTGAGNDAFVQVGSGDSTVLSGANSFRLIYNAGTAQAEISTNGGAYVPIGAGGVSPWTAAAGVITEVVPANLVVVGSAAALTADQFQVLGNSVLRASVDSTSTFAVQDAATNPIFFVDTVNNAAFARGSFQMASGLTAEVYVESGPSTAAISGVGAGRIRYHNVGTPAWEVSINGGAYYPLITTNTLPNTAFVQNGNSFGGAARLGTNDAHPLLFETNGASRAEISTTGIFLINSAAAVSTEQLSVVGGILSAPNGVSQDAFLQVGDGALAAVGTASSARFRYNGGVAQVSLNAAAYTDLITASSLPSTAFVQGGNSFGAAAVLGTNDAFELLFETSGTTKARITTGGALLVGYASPVVSETLGTSGNAYVGGSLTISSAGSVTVANSGSVVITDSTTGSLATVQSSGGTTSFSVTDIAGQLVTALPGSIQIGDSVNLLTLQAANITGSGNILISTAGGVSQLDGIIAIVSASLGPVSIQGAAGIDLSTAAEITINSAAGSAGDVLTSQGAGLPPVWAAPAPPTTAFVQGGNSFGADAVLGTNDAFALLFETSGTTRGRWTAAGEFLVAAAAVSGTESLRVSGGGALVDGSQLVASVTSTMTLNNSGGAINIGSAADAQAINIGTGAAARTITMGNVTGATSLVLNAGTGAINIGTTAQARSVSVATGAAAQAVTIGSQTGTSSMTIDAGTGTVNIATSASARSVNLATSAGAAQTVTLGSTNATSSMTINTGGAMSIATSATARTISFGTAAAAQTINFGSISTTSSLNLNFGTSGFNTTQGAATSGTPTGFVFTAGAHTGLATAELTDVNWNLARTATFTGGGGTITTQRALRVQAPTYAAGAGGVTMTDAATLAIGSAPVAGANVSFTRAMALWVQGGAARFDAGVSVAIVPGGTALQGLGADFRKQNNPAVASYPAASTTVITSGSYTPASGYRSIVPAWWTLPVATTDPVSGLPVNSGIRFTWSDGTTTTRTNTSAVAALTETRDAVDWNKDGYTIVQVEFVVQNTSPNAVNFDFDAWTIDGQQF